MKNTNLKDIQIRETEVSKPYQELLERISHRYVEGQQYLLLFVSISKLKNRLKKTKNVFYNLSHHPTNHFIRFTFGFLAIHVCIFTLHFF